MRCVALPPVALRKIRPCMAHLARTPFILPTPQTHTDANAIASRTSNALSSALRLRKAEFRSRELQKKLDAAVAELARAERRRLRAEHAAEDGRARAAAAEARSRELGEMLAAARAAGGGGAGLGTKEGKASGDINVASDSAVGLVAGGAPAAAGGGGGVGGGAGIATGVAPADSRM